MKAWFAVCRKDFRLTSSIFIIGLLINTVIVMLTLYLGMKADHTLLIFLPMVVAVICHIVYVPVMLGISLKTESNQLDVWLHNPQSAAKLLFSKLTSGMVMLVVSLLMMYVMSGLLIMPKFNLIEVYWTDTWTAGALIFLHIMLLSFLISICVVFLWTLFQYLTYKVGKWRWLVIIGSAIVPLWLKTLFETTTLYRVLTHWGSITYQFPTFSIHPIQTFVGEYGYNIILVIGLFLLSAWIMDNKIEV